jgi:hypothetical protein
MSLLLAPLWLTVAPAGAQIQKGDETHRLGIGDGNGPPPPQDRTSTALRFTADGQSVMVPNTEAVGLISGELTMEAWVRPEAGILSRGYSSIVSKQLGGTGYMLATNNRAGTPDPGHAFKAEVGGSQVTSGAQPAIDGWQHVAAVWQGGHLRIYVNGQVEGMIETGVPIPNAFPLWIGASPFGGDTNWRGSIDEVRIWAVARTQPQIQSGMNRRLCGDERGLRAYWTLDEGEGLEIIDETGFSNGVVSGAQWVPGVALLSSGRCRNKIAVEAFVDGRSRLILKKRSAVWHHLDFAAPGRWASSNHPTIINGEEWFPVWPDVPDAENAFCNCFSDVFKDVDPAVHHAAAPVVVRIRHARGIVAILQQPSAENDYVLVVEFDDNPYGGAATYLIDLLLRSGDKERYKSRR